LALICSIEYFGSSRLSREEALRLLQRVDIAALQVFDKLRFNARIGKVEIRTGTVPLPASSRRVPN